MYDKYNQFNRNLKHDSNWKIRSRSNIIQKRKRLYKRAKKARRMLSKTKSIKKNSFKKRKAKKFEFNSSSTQNKKSGK